MKKRDIHAALVRQGKSFRGWSIAHDYKPRTVMAVVDRWAGRSTQPHGRLAHSILRDLSREVGKEIVPGILG